MKLPQGWNLQELRSIDWRTTVSLVNGCLAMLFLLLAGHVAWNTIETIVHWIR